VGLILGLLALMALAYLGGHRRVLAWEQRLGISQVITAGLPFIVLGMVARLPSVGILTDRLLDELKPLLRVGLGSVGFVAGFRFDARLFQGMPKGTSSVAMVSTLLPALTVALASAPLLLLFSGASWSTSVRDPFFVRDALILATAGAMTARSAIHLHEDLGRDSILARVVRLEEFAGVLGLALIAAFFRASGLEDSWNLPGTMWILITLGLGAALGLLSYTILMITPRGPDFLAVTLGIIAFSAGAAGYFHLSSVAVAFVAGVILANFPGTFQTPLRDMLKRIERPIYLLALFVIGALWDVDDWRGWVLMPVFMVARLAGKRLAAMIAARDHDLPIQADESRALAVSPIGAMAIAIVVNAELLYPGGSIGLVVSAVIGGGVLTEAFVQLASRRGARANDSAAATSAPPTATVHPPGERGTR
jgi:Kef-type K+ transport system membrane component KefB